MSFIFGGGGSSGGGGGSTTSTGTQTNIAREAPEVEARKLSLYDQAAKLATAPVNLPGLQVDSSQNGSIFSSCFSKQLAVETRACLPILVKS